MLRIETVMAAGSWSGAIVDRVRLTYDERHRRRIVLTCLSGRQVLLDLPEARVLHDGDALVTDTGQLILVEAAPEPLMEVTCRDSHSLLRVAWHLGNRHLPTQIVGHGLRVREDHVIEHMLRGLGADVERVQAAFDPEGGAYEHGAAHHHRHARDSEPLVP